MSEEPDGTERTTQAERIYRELRDAILTGDIDEGSELNQVTLARQFGVSRIPVREALHRLHAEHLLHAEPFHRHTVRRMSPEQLEELIEIRMGIECLALRRHGAHLGVADLEALANLNASLKVERDPQRWLEGDWELHRILSGGDTAAAELAGDVRRRIHRYLNAAARMGDRHVAAVADHEAILDALAGGDVAEAERRLRRHIEATGEALARIARDGP